MSEPYYGWYAWVSMNRNAEDGGTEAKVALNFFCRPVLKAAEFYYTICVFNKKTLSNSKQWMDF